jgi:predicted DNA-binding helix-hairpin-helix protein
MDPLNRLKMLSAQMHLEPAEDAQCPQHERMDEVYISRAVLPNGQQIGLLKTLQTSVCERDCCYCPFRAGRDFRRTTLKPDVMASLFMEIHRAGVVDGIFLSSGIVAGGIYTQDKIIATAEILRHKLGYHGYMHLKIMPGSEREQVRRTMQLADRVSINLEAPNNKRLNKLAPLKEFTHELIQPLRWMDEIRIKSSPQQAWKGRWPSSVTQFVVGGSGESDLELLSTTDYLYKQLHLKRAYFSPFSPVEDTPLENLPPTPVIREHRLYQSSYLLRDYGFDLEELPFDSEGNLPKNIDPKLAWASNHLSEQPIDLNLANRRELLRVPGIGPKSATAIMKARKTIRLREIDDLTKIGINPKRSVPYILLDGRRPAYQMSLL